MISRDIVDILLLTTQRHPKPYYTQWLHNVGKLFSIDGYIDKVKCDVVPMHVCNLLLRHPWQFDQNATHQGRSNLYTFMRKRIFQALLPKTEGQIKCDIVVSIKTLVKNTSKLRTILLQREDDRPQVLLQLWVVFLTHNLRFYLVLMLFQWMEKKKRTCIGREGCQGGRLEGKKT